MDYKSLMGYGDKKTKKSKPKKIKYWNPSKTSLI